MIMTNWGRRRKVATDRNTSAGYKDWAQTVTEYSHWTVIGPIIVKCPLHALTDQSQYIIEFTDQSEGSKTLCLDYQSVALQTFVHNQSSFVCFCMWHRFTLPSLSQIYSCTEVKYPFVRNNNDCQNIQYSIFASSFSIVQKHRQKRTDEKKYYLFNNQTILFICSLWNDYLLLHIFLHLLRPRHSLIWLKLVCTIETIYSLGLGTIPFYNALILFSIKLFSLLLKLHASLEY